MENKISEKDKARMHAIKRYLPISWRTESIVERPAKMVPPEPDSEVEKYIERWHLEYIAQHHPPEAVTAYMESHRKKFYYRNLAYKVISKQSLTTFERKMIFEALTGDEAPNAIRGRRVKVLRNMDMALKYLKHKNAGKKSVEAISILMNTYGHSEESTFKKAIHKGLDNLALVDKLQDECSPYLTEEGKEFWAMMLEYRREVERGIK